MLISGCLCEEFLKKVCWADDKRKAGAGAGLLPSFAVCVRSDGWRIKWFLLAAGGIEAVAGFWWWLIRVVMQAVWNLVAGWQGEGQCRCSVLIAGNHMRRARKNRASGKTHAAGIQTIPRDRLFFSFARPNDCICSCGIRRVTAHRPADQQPETGGSLNLGFCVLGRCLALCLFRLPSLVRLPEYQ